MLDGREPQKLKFCEAGSGCCRPWGVVLVLNTYDHMYLGRIWEQFANTHVLWIGHFIIFSYDGDVMFTVKVFNMSICHRHYHDNDDAGNGGSIDYGYSKSNSGDEEEQSEEEEEKSGEPQMDDSSDDEMQKAMVVGDDDLAMVEAGNDLAMVVAHNDLTVVVPDNDLMIVGVLNNMSFNTLTCAQTA
ncbi:B3 domain-containing protein [Hordeum vulgare]|nr:B3 domain-containing protein [Hordeum vulgare]